MKSQLPKSWSWTPIVELLDENSNGKPFQQGWSPQCHNHPASDNYWGVLKTTAIQDGEFWGHENKQLPESIEPRPNLEIAKDDILMTCAGPRNRCGVVCFVKETRPKLLMSGKMYRFRPNSTILDSKYLEGFIRSHQAQRIIDSMKTGISDSGLNLTHGRFSELMVPFAPLHEQKRIVAKIEELFSELDNGIAVLKTAREQLKVYRLAVLKHALEGKLTAKWREDNAHKLGSPEQLLAHIKQEREARYQQQLEEWKAAVKAWEENGKEGKKPGKPKIAKIPKNIEQEIAQVNSIQGWYLAPLEVLITEINQGWSPKCELNRTPDDGEWAVIKTSALQPLQYVSKECKPLPPEFEPRPGLEVQVGDILMTRKGPRIRTGVVCLVKETRKNSMLCDTVYRFRAIDKAVDSEFLELALNSPAIVSELDQRKSGISDSGISLNHGKLKSIPIPISSSFEEQKLVVSLIREKIEYINRMDLEIDNQLLRSETLRQSILEKAVSGQLVPQDPSDEPVRELLARIRAEKVTEKAAQKASAKPKPGAKRGRKPKAAS